MSVDTGKRRGSDTGRWVRAIGFVLAPVVIMTLLGMGNPLALVVAIALFVMAFGNRAKPIWSEHSLIARLGIGLAFGMVTTWVSLPLSVTRYRTLGPEEKAAWAVTHGLRGDPWEDVYLVAGFPLRGVQGHDEFHGHRLQGSPVVTKGIVRQRVTVERGLLILWMNFALLCAVWVTVSFAIPVRWVPHAVVVASAGVLVGAWVGTVWIARNAHFCH